MLRVFVYGTLKPGEANFERYCAGRVAGYERAAARGRIFALPMGYPAMTPGQDWVQGYVLSFEEPGVLAALDTLEAYDPARAEAENEYYRAEVETFTLKGQRTGMAWVYLMDEARVRRFGGVALPDGEWSSRYSREGHSNV